MARYFADYGQVVTEPGELCYLAVDANEPSGKPILACRKVQVRLELAAVEDQGVLRDKGLAAMRQQRLARLAHKAQVVQLWLWGLQFTEIESRTRHSEASIKRYLADFRQIAALYARGAKIPEIRAATGRSAALIAEYIGLDERARREFPAAPRLYELLDVERATTKKGGRR